MRYSLWTMPKLHVEGGRPLSGTIAVSGAKNAASKMVLASLLTDETVSIANLPRQQETDIAKEIAETLGASFAFTGEHEADIRAERISSTSVIGLSRKNRLSILAIAPLLHRAKEAYVPKVGGDKIGPRPVDFHLDLLEKMGAKIEETPEGYRASVSGRLKGTLIELPYPSVGATESALFAGVLAEGRTVIRNAAGEPEVKALVMMLQNMGAVIQILTRRTIEIHGVPRLRGCSVSVMPDRIEAASYGSLALATGGDIFIAGAQHEHLITFLNAVRRVGADYAVQPDGILVRGAGKLRAIELETDTHPGFATDWQQPFVAALTRAEGTSIVHETVYEDRFGYTEALNRMGADIAVSATCLGETPCRFAGRNHRHSAIIKGPTPLHGADVAIPDIRAGLAFVVAALMAEGESILSGLEHLDRGYERLEEKLLGVGAKIRREE